MLTVLSATPGRAATSEELPALPESSRGNLPDDARARLEALEGALQEALAADPMEPGRVAGAYADLCGFHFLYDFLDLAATACERAVSVESGAFRAHYLLGVVQRLLGDFEAASVSYEEALALEPEDVPTLIRLARIELALGDTAASRELFENALEIEPTSSAAHYGLGRIAVELGQFEQAIPHLEAALPDQPAGSIVHHQMGLAYRGLGDLERARHHLGLNGGEMVVFADPLVEGLAGDAQGPRAWARSGIRAHRGGRSDIALEMLTEASRLDPDDAWIRYNLGVVQRDSGDAEAAIRELSTAVRLDPDYRDAHYHLGQLMVEQGDLETAVRHFERAREIDPYDYFAWLDLSVALSRLGESERALRELEALVGEAPTLIEARLNLVTLLAQVGRDAEALRRVDEVLEGDATPAEVAEANLLKGRLLEASDPAGALRHYTRAVDLDPTLLEARHGLAMGLGRQGRFVESAAQFEELVALAPDDPELRMGQTMALLLGEDYEGALAALESATARMPASPALRHLLARLLATCPAPSVRDGERALGLARVLLEQEQTLEHAETMAMALAELGRYEEAADWQRRVVEQRQLRGSAAPSLALSGRYLAQYERGEPVRAPWLGGA